jgi:integrase
MKPSATFSLNRDLHDPPRSPFWFASFRDSDGRRVRRSTKTTDKLLAQEIAMKWASLAKSGRDGRLTESQCRNVIAELYERAVGEPLHFRTAREFLKEWVESKKQETDVRVYFRYRETCERFLDHLGVKADRLLREITSADVRSWRDALKRKGLSAPTVNHAVKILRMPFSTAHEAGYIDINPCTKNSVRLLHDEAENVTKDVFTPAQIAALIKAAPSDDWRGMILCGYFTGLRQRDIADLQWHTLDFSDQTLTLRPHKTAKRQPKKKVVIPLHPQFMVWLRKQTRGIGIAPVFPTLFGKDGGGNSGLSQTFRRIMERAGIKGRVLREASGEGRSLSSLSFHSLRHSFNAALANAGIGVEMRQELIGHSSLEMNAIYTHPDIEVKRQAILKLPRVTGGKAK